MKKNYFEPTTKVVTVNVNSIMDAEMDVTSNGVDPGENGTEAPLF